MKKNILSFAVFAALSGILTACGGAGNTIKVKVENTEKIGRAAEMVEVRVADIVQNVRLGENEAYEVRDNKGNVVPSQLTHDGLLIFQSGLTTRGKTTFAVTAGPVRDFEPRTYGRHIKERLDDFAWENDRVAFRIYGPALVPVDGPSNGIDAWYKRTDKLVIDKWYADDLARRASYHNDNGEGLDDYKVGRTLGAGGMAPYVGGQLWLNSNYTSYELLDNGPLRTTFRVAYPDVEVVNEKYSESRTFSIDAGSNFTKVIQEYGFTEPTVVAAGFPVHGNAASTDPEVRFEEDWFVYKEAPTNKVNGIWLGLVFPKAQELHIIEDEYDIPRGKQKGNYKHLLALATYSPGKPFVYYTGYGWREAGFPSFDDFATYAADYANAASNPLRVTLK